MRRDVAIEIVAPTLGLDKTLGESMISPRSSPNLKSANCFYGMLQKDYGTTIFATGVGAVLGEPINLIYEANFGANSVLEVFTHTGMYKYTADSDTFVSDGQIYTGTFTDCWSACMHNDAMIYSNGVDLVQYKPTYSATGTVMGGVTDSSFKALSVISFANHLNLYHTVENGSECSKRVRWTKAGLLSYNSLDWSTGYSGFVDLQDMEGNLMTAERLGNNSVVIYGEGSIHMQEWVGGSDVYRFTKMVVDEGTPSRRGVVSNGNVHYVMTHSNIYEYWGGRDLKPIGDKIRTDWTSMINHSALQYAFMEFLPNDYELRVHVPTGVSTHPDTVFICKIREDYAWYVRPEPYTAKGVFSRPSAMTIGQLSGNIGAQNWKFGDLSIDRGSITYLLGDKSGRVVKRDKTAYSLSESGTSAPQVFFFDTKDLSSVGDIDPLIRNKYELSEYMDNQTRWLQLKVEAKGHGLMHLQYSTDAGYNWTTFSESPFTIDSTWKMYTADVDIAAEKFMVRISNSATNEVVHVRYAKLSIVPGGEIG